MERVGLHMLKRVPIKTTTLQNIERSQKKIIVVLCVTQSNINFLVILPVKS